MEAFRAIESAASSASGRLALWSSVINYLQLATTAEIGVGAGTFARHILEQCSTVERYYMIDPWRHLDNWNKPANKTDREFAKRKQRALALTQFAEHRRIVLEGTTTEVSHQLPDGSLDLAYIDGDHTLRGITIDLIRIWPKMRHGGVIAGDDFCPSIWNHPIRFEPTLVFPLAVHFAEAVDCVIYGLPFNQFVIVIERPPATGFEFRDLTNQYTSSEVRDALAKKSGRQTQRTSRHWR